ncbi:peptidase M23 [Microbacterium sp.]|uniref:peptidase M23 n=1 Tax=Microbacterium sp. TaxID=51671 RepID=UPI002D770EFF|nr:peptidase M23 [Microbacterium sp.]HET6301587.1 peptidase M23 [Microbacterium sp.]
MARSAKPASGTRRAASARRRTGAKRAHARSPRRATPAQRRRKAQRARRWRIALITAASALAVAAVISVIVIVGLAARALSDLGTGLGGIGDAITDPGPFDTLARYDDEQLANAGTIVTAACDLGLGTRDQAIGVMTAMGESSLRNIEYGDWETSGVTNPDGSPTTSIGLFQQQDGWGTREQRLDPYTSATIFFQAMLRKVPDPERQQLEPTIVAHRTQINRDPEHYAKYWTGAVQVVDELRDRGVGCGE